MQAPPAGRGRRKSVVALVCLAAVLCAAVYVAVRQGDPARAHIEAGQSQILMNRGEAAEREWREAVRLNPHSAAAWELLSEYYTRTGNYEAAVDSLRHLAHLKPDAPLVYEHLATCASNVEDPQALLRGTEADLQRDPNDVGALAIATKLLSKSDDEQKRLTLLRRLAQLRPNDVSTLVQLARTLTNAHFYDEAAPVVERIFQRDPNSVEAYGLRGRRWLDTGSTPQDLARAEADFQKVLELNPSGPMPHLHLGKLYLRTGQPDRAVTHLEQAAERLPNLPEVWFHLAVAYTQAKRPDRAAAARARFAALRQRDDLATVLEKRCVADPKDFQIHLQRGLLALDKGEYEKADYYLSRAQTLRPGDPQSTAALKRLAAATGEGSSPALGGGR